MNDESNVIQPAPTSTPTDRHTVSRRGFVARATAAAGLAAAECISAAMKKPATNRARILVTLFSESSSSRSLKPSLFRSPEVAYIPESSCPVVTPSAAPLAIPMHCTPFATESR